MKRPIVIVQGQVKVSAFDERVGHVRPVAVADDSVRMAREFGISIEDARAVCSGDKRLSEIPAAPNPYEFEPPDYDEFYDDRAQLAILQDMHEARHF